MIFPPSDCSARVVEPREEALDLPASADATQRSAILGARTATPVCGDHLDAVLLLQEAIERIAVVAAVADQSRREVSEESGVEGRGDEVWLIR